ncbi:glycosyl hydrolase family 32, partial [Chloroflexi bacterium TSY]|nr:glycosyl hydrolase family 32 [Chloroflexi bacterium TSY]
MTNQTLYNGIVLPETWPPRNIAEDPPAPIPVPYLANPPAVIPIDVGRQLFVDDFLIESTSLTRVFGKPEIHPQSPVLMPETEEEMDFGNCPMAAPFNDGVWYDPQDQLFKLWYMPGWFHSIALATSRDGIHWERPNLDVVPGTNLAWPNQEGSDRDGCLVWLDHFANDADQRFKMFQYYRHYSEGIQNPRETVQEGWLQVSPDGIHWSDPVITTRVGDNSSFFYNPFRQKWCMSIRRASQATRLRARYYHESDDFLSGAQWDMDTDEVFWQRVDQFDLPDPARPNHRVALYDVNVTPYESLMLGMFAIFRGPENDICAKEGVPKTMDLEVGYSRDGFHFSRPDRTPFLASSRRIGDWNRAYLHAAGGICLVVHDQIYIYFGAFSGISPKLGPTEAGSPGLSRRVMYAGASTGLATLRRDGFAGMEASSGSGDLTTRPIIFKGDRLFVNVNAPDGDLRMAVFHEDGTAVEGLTANDCTAISLDNTSTEVTWISDVGLAAVAGQP